MKKALTGILVAAGAAGVFLVYKNWDKIIDKLKGDNDNGDPGTGTQELKPETGYQSLPYNEKVEVLQGLLQIKIDGHAADQTNGNMDFYYDLKRENSLPSHIAQAIKAGFPNLKANGRGPVNESNVDFYIEQFQTAQTPRQKTWKFGGYASAEAQARANYGKKLEAAYQRGEKVRFIRSFDTIQKTFDRSKNAYIPVPGGKKIYFVKDRPLYKGPDYELTFDYDANGYWLLNSKRDRNKPGSKFTHVNPYLLY
jgi:hypothetical protein